MGKDEYYGGVCCDSKGWRYGGQEKLGENQKDYK